MMVIRIYTRQHLSKVSRGKKSGGITCKWKMQGHTCAHQRDAIVIKATGFNRHNNNFGGLSHSLIISLSSLLNYSDLNFLMLKGERKYDKTFSFFSFFLNLGTIHN